MDAPRRLSAVAFLSLVALLALGGGCEPAGPKLIPVTGSVTVNGKPAASAIVFFHRKGKSDISEPTPYATAGEDGAFAVSFDPTKSGALTGEYTVTLVWPDMTKEPDGNGGRPDLLRGGFDKVAASKFAATVGAGPTQLPPFEVSVAPASVAPQPAAPPKGRGNKPKDK